MLAIRFGFYTLSRRPSPVAKKRSNALSLNDRITSQDKSGPHRRQAAPYRPAQSQRRLGVSRSGRFAAHGGDPRSLEMNERLYDGLRKAGMPEA